MTASEIAGLEVVNTSTISNAISQISTLKVNRLIVTDQAGIAIYDSAKDASVFGKYVLLPEIVTASYGNNVFSWNYRSGTMLSKAAVPVYANGFFQATGQSSLLHAHYSGWRLLSQGSFGRTG